MTKRCFALAVLVASVSLAPAVATAQDEVEAAELETEARARFSLGQLYYGQARFAEAAREFEAAYASHPHPLLLHNIYLARRDMGDLPGAIDALTQYLAAATELSAQDRRVLERRLAAMQQQVEQAGTPVAQSPSEPMPSEPTLHEPTTVATSPEAGARTEPARASPRPSDASARPSGGDDGLTTGAIVSFSIAGAALVTAVITGPMALGERDHLASSCAPACTDEQVGTARTLGLVTDVGIVVGVVGAAAGVVLAVLASTSVHADVVVTPSVSADHVGIVVGGAF